MPECGIVTGANEDHTSWPYDRSWEDIVKRSDFLRAAGGAAAAATVAGSIPVGAGNSDSPGESQIPKRHYRGGVDLSVIGFGGIVVTEQDQADADRCVAEAFDRGVNYFDVAPSYGEDGEAEKKLGIALKPYRERVFLACKTIGTHCGRSPEGVRTIVETSPHRSFRPLPTSRCFEIG